MLIWSIIRNNIQNRLLSFFKKIFKKEEKLPPYDLSLLNVDVHSHFIPGIDDGAQTIDESLDLLRQMEEFGYKKVITTPHIMLDYYKNTPEIILSGLDKVKNAIQENGLQIEIEASAEYNLDLGFEEIIKEDKVLSFGGDNKYVLFELSFYNEPKRLKEVIWELNMKGFKPILAHVERYAYWHKKWDKIEDIVNRDVKLQVNIGSFTGVYGIEVKNTAQRLVDEGLVDLIGSDCHNMRHIDVIKEAVCLPYFHKACENPDLINKHL